MTAPRSPEMESFVADARAVSVASAFERCGYSLRSLRASGPEHVGPCPSCGGKDRFSLNTQKNVFNCRGAEGGDALGLVKHLTGLDFLDACELVTGRDRRGARGGDDFERLRRRAEAERRLDEQRERAARGRGRARGRAATLSRARLGPVRADLAHGGRLRLRGRLGQGLSRGARAQRRPARRALSAHSSGPRLLRGRR